MRQETTGLTEWTRFFPQQPCSAAKPPLTYAHSGRQGARGPGIVRGHANRDAQSRRQGARGEREKGGGEPAPGAIRLSTGTAWSGILSCCARVAEWQTRRSQKPLFNDVRVRLSPRAPSANTNEPRERLSRGSFFLPDPVTRPACFLHDVRRPRGVRFLRGACPCRALCGSVLLGLGGVHHGLRALEGQDNGHHQQQR